MVKRITQNSPTRCSLTPCQLFSSIRPSIVPSFAPSSLHLPVCGYLCLFSSFHPCQEDYIVPLSHVFPTHPPFVSQLLCFPSQRKKPFSHFAATSPNHLSQTAHIPTQNKVFTPFLSSLQQSQTAGSFTISHLNLISRMSLPALEGRGWWWWMSKFTLGNQSVLLSLPWERLSADPKTRKWSKTLVYEVSKSNERCILRWKLGRMVGVGGDTALHRGIPMGGWYGKMERGGGGVQRGH